MRRFVPLILALVLAAPAFAGTDAAKKDWSTYGAPITSTKPVRLDRAAAKHLNQEILVQGKISDVCSNKGCWMTVKDGKQEVRVEFKDYGFFVPWSASGKPVKMQGVLTEKTMSPEDQEHIASEAKQGGGVGEPSKEPKKLLVFTASGVAIQGGGELPAEQQAKIGGKPAEAHDHSDPNHKH
jgi:hypothetical protein